MTTISCCAECGKEGDVSLKVCKACMQVKYCDAICQHKNWATHKIECKLRAAELRDEALFKDPPPKEECPICFLPMPQRLLSCMTLPPATRSSVPIYDFAKANQELVTNKDMEIYVPCCGKSICGGCVHSFNISGNNGKCPFCNADRRKTEEERVEEMMKRVEANDPASIYLLADSYHYGLNGIPQDQTKAIEFFTKSAELGCSKAHNSLGIIYQKGGAPKKAKFRYEAAAMAGHEGARYNLGTMEYHSGNIERAVKHWKIAASAGDYGAMIALRKHFEIGVVTRESIDSILIEYNMSCAEIRNEARDAYIQFMNINRRK